LNGLFKLFPLFFRGGEAAGKDNGKASSESGMKLPVISLMKI